MSNYMEEAFAPAKERYRQAVLADTWGHLAPIKDKTYKGRLVVAVGCLGSDPLNPTLLAVELGDLDCSPWFYNAVNDFISDSDIGTEDNAGCIYEWLGAFRNYMFKGSWRLILNTNKTAQHKEYTNV